jgi:hypothetical protein
MWFRMPCIIDSKDEAQDQDQFPVSTILSGKNLKAQPAVFKSTYDSYQ